MKMLSQVEGLGLSWAIGNMISVTQVIIILKSCLTILPFSFCHAISKGYVDILYWPTNRYIEIDNGCSSRQLRVIHFINWWIRTSSWTSIHGWASGFTWRLAPLLLLPLFQNIIMWSSKERKKRGGWTMGMKWAAGLFEIRCHARLDSDALGSGQDDIREKGGKEHGSCCKSKTTAAC